MNRQLFSLIGLLACIYTTKVSAQKFTLKQCIDYAWSNNLDIKQSELNNASANIDVKASKAILLPNLSASAGQNYQFGRTVDRFTNTFINQTIRSNNFGLSAGVLLFSGFQNQNNIKQKRFTQEASEETIQYTKNLIALNISSSFLQAIQGIESINNAQLQIASTQQRIEKAQKQVDAGVADLSNLLTLKAQVANEQLNLVNAINNKNVAMLSLRNLMQLPIDEALDIIIPSVESITSTKNPVVLEIYETALNNLPQIKSAIKQSEAANAQTNYTKGALSPSISLYGSLSTVYSQSAQKYAYSANPIGYQTIGITQNSNELVVQPIYAITKETIKFGDQFKNNIGQGAGLSFSWNLFNGFQVQNSIQKAKINQLISDMNLQKQKNTLMNDINTAVNSYNAAKARYDASLNNVDAQKTSLDYIQKRFDAGVTTTFDFINAKNGYLQAQSNELQAKYELIFRALIIEYYRGNTITF
ncbi:MAG: TolC family protein [bacterium]|nr:TolC family protein [bacterium]